MLGPEKNQRSNKAFLLMIIFAVLGVVFIALSMLL